MAWSRNFGRGPGQISVNLRVAKTIGFGAEVEGPRADPRPGPRARVLKMARGSTRRRMTANRDADSVFVLGNNQSRGADADASQRRTNFLQDGFRYQSLTP